MISRLEQIVERLSHGDVAGAFDRVMDRARIAAQVPSATVDPFQDFKDCLNRAIQEMCLARNDI